MEFSTDSVMVKLNGAEQEFTLEQLAELNMDTVPEYTGFVSWPAMLGVWEVEDMEFSTREDNEGNSRPIIRIPLKCLAAEMKEPHKFNADDFVDETYPMTIWVSDVARDFGKLKSLLKNSGFSAGNSSLRAEAEAFGQSKHRFMMRLTTTPRRDDKSRWFTNEDYGKDGIRPYVAPAGTGQSPAPAAATGGQPAPVLNM